MVLAVEAKQIYIWFYGDDDDGYMTSANASNTNQKLMRYMHASQQVQG